MTVESVPLRPAWVEVDLGAIEHNTRRLVEIARGADLMAMVKANAYGHGAVPVSQATLRGGATWLGVFSAGEGIQLRRAGINAPILVVGYTPPDWTRAAVEHRLTLAVFSIESATTIDGAARELGLTARVHIKIDTGMTRLGILPEQAAEFGRAVSRLANVEIEGAFTHFAMADTPDAHGVKGWGKEYTQNQLGRFRTAVQALEREGISLRYRHCANSPATLELAEARFNLVRSGILIYGLDPSPEVPRPRDFIPALSFKTQVALVKAAPAGAFVSYGATFRTARPSRLAVLMVGYGDGFRRKPSNYGEVLVRGKRAPIVGRVCMDQTMVDVTDIEGVQAGDEVVLIGRQGAEEISAEQVADRLGTNNYETVATLSDRLERRYSG
ncbi:MAG TPA: alanine racemase [Anaerolineae bacterium]